RFTTSLETRACRLLIVLVDFVASDPYEVEEARERRKGHDRERKRLGLAFPQAYQRTDARVGHQPGIEPRLVGVMEHVHHVRAADTRRVVQARLLEAARFQVLDALGSVLFHILLGTEHQGSGRAGLDARRLHAHGDAIGAQRALIGLVVALGNARNVERACRHAVAAADAVFLLEVHDAVGVLHDGAGRRTGLETARIVAVHAAVLAD